MLVRSICSDLGESRGGNRLARSSCLGFETMLVGSVFFRFEGANIGSRLVRSIFHRIERDQSGGNTSHQPGSPSFGPPKSNEQLLPSHQHGSLALNNLNKNASHQPSSPHPLAPQV